MRRWLEALETFAIDVILERRYGRRADVLRWILHGLAAIYRVIVQIRLALYRNRYLRPRSLGCVVISVGNLTVGGTGKTPVVEMLARALQAGGRHVAILSRGYKSVPRPLLLRVWDAIFQKKAVFAPRIVSDGNSLLLDSRTSGDEPFMLANNLRGVVVLVDPDRVTSGQYAIDSFGADTLLLDDGLQYVRMRHGIEIVLIDSQALFGNEYLLPRGTLREPPQNLRRATHIFLTKCTDRNNGASIARIRQYNRTADIIECAHRPRHLRNLVTGEIKSLEFLRDLEIGSKFYTDHHRYSVREIENFIRRCGRRGLTAIITTEKDAVRIPRILEPEVPIYYLRVEIEILGGQETWVRFVERLTTKQQLVAPLRF
jgi:tetraacyldisaccharide 4'-kinase